MSGERITGESPFSHSGLDIKTFAMALLGKGYGESTKKNMPRRWFDNLPHSHVALDDAIGQGALFCTCFRKRSQRNLKSSSPLMSADPANTPINDDATRPPAAIKPACPACGGRLIEVRAKLQCERCRTICETCCEGGGPWCS